MATANDEVIELECSCCGCCSGRQRFAILSQSFKLAPPFQQRRHLGSARSVGVGVLVWHGRRQFDIGVARCGHTCRCVQHTSVCTHAWHIAAQSFTNYLLLAMVYTTWLSCRQGGDNLMVVLASRGWRYACVALLDVLANYLVVRAFQYTNLTSVQVCTPHLHTKCTYTGTRLLRHSMCTTAVLVDTARTLSPVAHHRCGHMHSGCGVSDIRRCVDREDRPVGRLGRAYKHAYV